MPKVGEIYIVVGAIALNYFSLAVVAVVFWGDPQFNIDIGVNSDQPYPCNVSSVSSFSLISL
jgi:hypothetical protein